MGTLVVLVGPKGSGKTTIGAMLEACGVRFVEVERVAQAVRARDGGPIDEGYARRAFAAIAEALEEAAARGPIAFETTGAADETGPFLDGLRARHRLVLVRVRAPEAVCRARIAARDGARQVPVPPELVAEMHRRTEALAWAWDAELVNDPPLDAAAVTAALGPLLDGLVQRGA